MTNNKELTSTHFDNQKMENINNKQQSSVEWLQSIELERDLTLADWKQAKEMEKHRMIEFTNEWFEEYQCGLDNFKNPEKYYEQTYGGGNK
jgi:membrane protein involved in colicin uptake